MSVPALYRSRKKLSTVLLFTLCLMQYASSFTEASYAAITPKDLTVLVGNSNSFTLEVFGEYNTDLTLTFVEQHDSIVTIDPSSIVILANSPPKEYEVSVYGHDPGRLDVWVNATPDGIIDTNEAFVKVTVLHSNAIYHISSVVGWIYFVAWSISFYPQIYINFKRKSVVGLNFDFISLNIVGFVLYSLFNLGLFYIPEVQEEYFNRYPRGLNPIQVNDIFFSLHAVLATTFTIVQCFLYERENQRVSTTARIILGIFGVVILVSLILAATIVITWLDFLYYCSYIKLSITLIKYVPQAYMNYRRKSTVGWSIGNIFLDFVGGTLSMLQMILNAYNYNDWVSIFGDPTKFGLGLFSVIFDIFFMIQHYVLYRGADKIIDLSNSI
ncbi:lysosomal cystine transporter cystinosin isoform X2 [Arctopsyche grandis]|uniref:lysosomal cystine transporter cystinosin isoform X2 n=1 Tax=Arctopsyche grandis TaxID=121162 RepID=UPI00406D6B28